MSAAEVIAQQVWQAYVVELGRSMPEGLADKLAADVVPALRAAGYAVVRVPEIAFKGPHDTNGTMLITAADKAESARYPVGGSNVGRAVAQVLREVAAAADATEASDE